MISNLVWNPAAGGGTQTIQFKPHSSLVWITYETVGPTVSSLGVTGLNYNTLYDFQVVNNCPTGSTSSVASQDIVIQCPLLSISPADTSVTIQFADLGGSIDSYKIDLLDSTSTTVIQTQTLVPPFSPILSTVFGGLSPLTTYNVRITPGSSTFIKTDCTIVSFKTTNTPICPAPVGLAVIFS